MTDPTVYNWNSAGDNSVKVPFRTSDVFPYKFTITATADGGRTYTSPVFTLNTIAPPCDPSSTTISASTSPVVIATQAFTLDGTDPTFTFPKFVNSNPACPINSYTMNPVADGSHITMTDLTVYNQAGAGDNFVKVPSRTNVLDTYKFTVTATAVGGATYTSPEFTLNTVCGPASTTILASTSPVVTTPQFFTLDGTDPIFTFPKFVNSNPTCPINSYTINPSAGNTFMDPTVYNWNSAGDNSVKVSGRTSDVFTYSFTITATAVGGATYTSPVFTLDTIAPPCDPSSTTITLPVIPTPQVFTLNEASDP